MPPSIGRTVLYRRPKSEDPAGQWHPAVITLVHNSVAVNLTVFFDHQPPEWRTSVLHQDTASDDASCWAWPPRMS